MKFSTTPGLYQGDVVGDDEDLLPTEESIADIHFMGFPTEVSLSKFLEVQRNDELFRILMPIADSPTSPSILENAGFPC